jgi:hypothetical protein
MNTINFSIVRIALVVLAAIGVAACPPVTSKTPLGTTVAATPDPALTGVWKGRVATGDSSSYFAFLPQDDGTVSAVLVTPPTAKDKGGWAAFSVQTVTLGPNHFMNARETIDGGKPATGSMADNIVPVLYRINSDGALVLYIMDDTLAKAAIKSGKLTGNVESGQYGDVTLTSSAADLDAYMASPQGRALFNKPLVILRKAK